MELQYNNAAGRILALFEESLKRQDNDSTANVWAEVFSLDIANPGKKIHADNKVEIYRRLVATDDALVEVQSDIATLRPTDSGMYLIDFAELRHVLAPKSLEDQWAHYKPRIAKSALVALRFCARDLPIEGDISPDELQSILEAIHGLRQMIRESDRLSKSLKEWILDMLAAVERAVELYSIRGGRGLREALATLVGNIIVHPELSKEVQKEAAIAGALNAIYQRLCALAVKAKKLQPLIEFSGTMIELVQRTLGN
jgi:hypothetical protein